MLLRAACSSISLALGLTAQPPAEDPIRVLHVAVAPSWQYRYLTGALSRQAPAVQAQSWLLHAPAGFVQRRTPGLPPLAELPQTAKELFRYDVVLLDGVAPEDLGPQRARDTWVDRLVQFVAFGGGVGLLASAAETGPSWQGTLLPNVVPTTFLDQQALVELRVRRDGHPFRLVPAAAAGVHSILDLRRRQDRTRPARAADVAARWELLPRLRHWQPLAPTTRDGASSLLRHERARIAARPAVLAAVMEWQRGRTLVLGTAELWRLRRHDPAVHDVLWRNVVRWLAGGTRWKDDGTVGPADRPRGEPLRRGADRRER